MFFMLLIMQTIMLQKLNYDFNSAFKARVNPCLFLGYTMKKIIISLILIPHISSPMESTRDTTLFLTGLGFIALKLYKQNPMIFQHMYEEMTREDAEKKETDKKPKFVRSKI